MCVKTHLLLLVAQFLSISSIVQCQNIPRNLVVETTNGTVRGRQSRTVGLNLVYFAYQGIPYAQPPVGDLRFEAPLPAKNWTGVYNATQDKDICLQGDGSEGSEDCLHINVYVPQVSKYNTKLLPTMVWIFGGGFEAGFASYDLYGPDYLIEKDVVVVSFNYRLGIWGFISTGDLAAPGNNGFRDQVLALKWVRDNIKNFGGDPEKVTIFGQSAGSASVSYHLQSPLSRGLFHRAIMESGVSLSSWAFSRKNPEVVKKLADIFSIDTSSSQTMIDGLKKLDYETLQKQSSASKTSALIANDPRNGFIFGPVIEPMHENAFFTDKSHAILSRGDFAKVPCIIGYNSLEGTFNFNTLFRIYLLQYDANHSRLLPIDLNIDDSRKKEAAELIKKYYFGSSFIAFSERNLMKFLSDDQFVRPIREYVRLVSQHTPVYYYKFSYEGGMWGFTNRTISGVAHSEELGYIWRSKYTPSQKDTITRKRLISMWTDFAKMGNPTPTKIFTTLGVAWNQTDAKFTYLDIGEEIKLLQFPDKTEMELWDHIYLTYGNSPFDTY